jgi:hypothetical protein
VDIQAQLHKLQSTCGCSSAQLLKQLRTLEAAARLVQRVYRGYRGRRRFYKVAESIAYDA